MDDTQYISVQAMIVADHWEIAIQIANPDNGNTVIEPYPPALEESLCEYVTIDSDVECPELI